MELLLVLQVVYHTGVGGITSFEVAEHSAHEGTLQLASAGPSPAPRRKGAAPGLWGPVGVAMHSLPKTSPSSKPIRQQEARAAAVRGGLGGLDWETALEQLDLSELLHKQLSR